MTRIERRLFQNKTCTNMFRQFATEHVPRATEHARNNNIQHINLQYTKFGKTNHENKFKTVLPK